MKPRPVPLDAPATNRYWSTSDPRGLHHWRAPYFGVGTQLMLMAGAHASDADSVQQSVMDRLPFYAAILGACWWHREQALVATFPAQLTEATLTAYGHAVAEELQEADYTLLDILDLFATVLPAMRARVSIIDAAQARADFSPARTVVSTSSS